MPSRNGVTYELLGIAGVAVPFRTGTDSLILTHRVSTRVGQEQILIEVRSR